MAQDPTLVVLHKARKLHWQQDEIVLRFPKVFLDSIEKAGRCRVLSKPFCRLRVSLSVQLIRSGDLLTRRVGRCAKPHEQAKQRRKAARKRRNRDTSARQLSGIRCGIVCSTDSADEVS